MLKIADQVKVKVDKSAIAQNRGPGDQHMNKSLLWRGILILVVTVLMVVAFWPPEKKIKLGLDLRGGIHLVLRVKVEDALRAERDKVAERLAQEAQSQGAGAAQPQPLGPTAFARHRAARRARQGPRGRRAPSSPSGSRRPTATASSSASRKRRSGGSRTSRSTRRCRRSTTASTPSASPSR